MGLHLLGGGSGNLGSEATRDQRTVWSRDSLHVSRPDRRLGICLGLCRAFHNVFGSPNVVTTGHVCYIPKAMAQLHTFGRLTVPDYEYANTIVQWGANPTATNVPHAQGIYEALRRGAKLIVVDPMRTKLTSRAHIWLRPRPGSDGALALSMLHVIINEKLYDEDFVREWTVGFQRLADLVQGYPPEKGETITWVPADTIRATARLYATNGPACLAEGNGLEQHTNGVQTARAISILRAVTGNLDVPGGDLFPAFLPTTKIRLLDRLPQEVAARRLDGHELFYAVNNMTPAPSAIDAMLTGKPYSIKAVLVMGMNPLVSLANEQRVREAFHRLEFLAVADLFMTRTAELADLVLPTATSFEKTGLTPESLRADYVLLQKKIVEVEECWPDWKILFELARKLGYEQDFPWREVEEAIDYQLQPSGLTVERLRSNPAGLTYQGEARYRKYETTGFNTPSGKVEIYSDAFARHGYDPLPTYVEPMESPLSQPDLAERYPLIGNGGSKPAWYCQSQFRNIPSLRHFEPEHLLQMHPQDAETRDLHDGDLVRVTSPRGSIRLKLQISDFVAPGVVAIPWGWGQAIPEANVNRLVDDLARDPISGATACRSFLCQVEKEGAGGCVSGPFGKISRPQSARQHEQCCRHGRHPQHVAAAHSSRLGQ
jgi:anaerobic selenocysteine-containing dehydrogenase